MSVARPRVDPKRGRCGYLFAKRTPVKRARTNEPPVDSWRDMPLPPAPTDLQVRPTTKPTDQSRFEEGDVFAAPLDTEELSLPPINTTLVNNGSNKTRINSAPQKDGNSLIKTSQTLPKVGNDGNRPNGVEARAGDVSTNFQRQQQPQHPQEYVPTMMRGEARNERILDEKYDVGERFRPWTSSLVVGNREKVDAVARWLDSTDRIHEGKFRAALVLHGPPGCGKTSAIRSLLRERRYAIKEWSPADPFSSRADVDGISMTKHFREVYESTVYTSGRYALVLEEVDGVQLPLEELLTCLERTRRQHNPVLITCNRLYTPELRRLREHPTVACLAFYPLKNRDLRELWARWDEFWRWKETQTGKKRATPTWSSAQLEFEIQNCRGDARVLLSRDRDSRRISDRNREQSQQSDSILQHCDWRDVERWKNSRDPRFRSRVLPELSSLWKDARRWMGDKFYEDTLREVSETDQTLFSAYKLSDDWSACDVLDSDAWQEDQLEDGLGDILSCVQLLSLTPSFVNRPPRLPTKDEDGLKNALRRRSSPEAKWVRKSPKSSKERFSRESWDFPRVILDRLERETSVS